MSMRLDKYLCHNLGISRTDAKRIIRQGRVAIDNKTEKDASRKLGSEEKVSFDDVPVTTVGLEYYMLNKPAAYVCTNNEGLHPMIFDLLELVRPEKYHAAGRLDIDTTGLVLITNDGQWTHRVTSPGKELGKVYVVDLAEPIGSNELKQIENGLLLKGEKKVTLPAKTELMTNTKVRISIFEGRYHQIKRMFAAVGNSVVSLHRERIGEIKLDDALQPGEYRKLTPIEINSVNG